MMSYNEFLDLMAVDQIKDAERRYE